MAYTGNGIAGMLDTVDKTAGVYAGNPGKLKQAMDKHPKTIVDQLEEKATALTKNEVTGQVGDVLQQKQQKQQKAQQKMLAQATKPQGAGIGNLLGGAPQGGAPQGRPMPQGNPMQGGVAAAAGGLMRAQFKKGGDVDAEKFSVEGNIAQIEKYAESQGGKLSQQVMQSMAAASKNNRAIVDFLKTKYGFDGFAAGAEDLYGRTRMPSADNAAINERLRAENVDPNARTASTAVDAFMNYGSGPLVDKEGGGKRYMTQEERVAKQENEAGLKKAMADEDAQFGLEDDLERLMADEDAQFAADDTAGIDAQVQGVIEGGANPYAKVDAALAAAKGNAGESAGGLEIGSAAQDLTKENLKGLGALKEDGKVNPQPFKAEQEAARADSDKYYKRQANEDAYKKDMETRKKFYGEYDPEADKERQSEAFAAYVGRGKGGAAQGLQAQMQVRNAQSKAREGQMLGLEALGQKGREQDRLIADKGTSRYDSIGSNGTSILNAAVQGFSVASQQDMIAAREDLDRKDKTIARKMEANLAEAELEMKKITAAGEASATQRKDVLSLIVTAEDNILKAKQDIFAVYEPQISMAQQQGKDTAALIDVRDKAVDGVIAGYSGVLTKLNEMAGVNKPNLSGSPYSDSPDVNSIVGEKLKTKQ